MWHAVKQIAKTTTFYYKQLNIFLLVILTLGGAFFINHFYLKNNLQASTDVPASQIPTQTDDAFFDIQLDRSGTVHIGDEKLNGALSLDEEKHTVLVVVLRDNPTYFSSVRVRVTLPTAVTNLETLQPRIYAVHGVGPTYYRALDQKTLVFEARDVQEGAGLSLELSFPVDYFQLTALDQFRQRLVTIPSDLWVAIGSVLPLCAVLFLLYLLVKRMTASLSTQTTKSLTAPPLPTAPATIGALYHGKIGRREITATLFDLAVRGFVTMHTGANGSVVFGKGTQLFGLQATKLRAFEIFLLHQIFGDKGFSSHEAEIEGRLNQELFSSKMAMTIVNMYDAAVAEGYFVESPNTYYLKYKTVGMVSFFVGLAALLYGAFVLPEPAYILLFWLGMVAASLLIIFITPGLPPRTSLGTKTLVQWMGFRNFLTDTTMVRNAPSDMFFAYLPYAIVFDCEKEWVNRWRHEALILPDWFSADQTPYRAEDYAISVLSIVNFLANHLVVSRPPEVA